MAAVRGAASHPSRTGRGRPCASCRWCTRAEVEGVGGAWVASTASAIFSKSLERPRVPKSWKALLLGERRLSAQLMTLARRPRKVATTPSRRGERPRPGLQRAASVRQSSLEHSACRALSGWARRTSRAGLSCHLPLRTLARGCRRRRVVRPRVRGRSSSSGRAHYASGSARAPTSAASPRRRWTSGLRAAPARTPRRPRPRRSARAAPWSSRRRASAARRHSAVRARPSSSRQAVPRAAGRRSRRLATLRPANDASPSQQASRCSSRPYICLRGAMPGQVFALPVREYVF